VAQGYYLIAYAAAIMVMMAFCPYGLFGMVERGAKALRLRRKTEQSAPALQAERPRL